MTLARLGDAARSTPRTRTRKTTSRQMRSSPADTRKLWAQFKAHLEKFETAKDARAGRRRRAGLGAEGPVTRARRPNSAPSRRLAAVDARGRARTSTATTRASPPPPRRRHASSSRRRSARASARRRAGNESRALASASQSSAVLRVLGGAAVLATVGVFGMSKLATRLRLEHAAALGTKDERARLSVPDRVLPRRGRRSRRASPKTTTATRRRRRRRGGARTSRTRAATTLWWTCMSERGVGKPVKKVQVYWSAPVVVQHNAPSFSCNLRSETVSCHLLKHSAE